MAAEPDTETALLAPVLELTVLVAQAGAKLDPPVEPPSPLRPFLKFRNNIPTAALRAARTVLDTDSRFRAHLSEVVTAELVGEAGVLFVQRPQGWEQALAKYIAEEAALVGHLESGKSDRLVEKKRAAVQGALERSEAALAKLRNEHETTLSVLADERRTTSDQLNLSRAKNEQLSNEVARLTKRLAKAEADLALSERERALATAGLATEQYSAALVATELAAAHELREHRGHFDEALGRAVQAVQEVHASLLLLRSTPGSGDLKAAAGRGTNPDVTNRRPTSHKVTASQKVTTSKSDQRRKPSPIPGGVFAESAEAAGHLLRTPMMTVIVDGYNVAKLRWETLAPMELRDRLVNASMQLSARTGAAIHLVFDGVGEASTSVPRRASGVRVTFAPRGIEADDVILQLVDDAPVTAPITVVSNDRRVLDGASERGTNTLPSATFVAAWSRFSL